MAQDKVAVLVGFQDEVITENHKNQVNFMINKIGGKPDFPNGVVLESPSCPLCHLPRPLVVQIYAPLENSVYHRTLYLYACINPNCVNQSESWVCIRIQTQENVVSNTTETTNTSSKNTQDWCGDADDWDDDNNSNITDFNTEENGNLINNLGRISDEDDESCSFEESVRTGLGNLAVDDRNANVGALGGAVGRLHSPSATAEIEGDEGEVISIDTPTVPQHDISALLHEITPLPQELLSCRNVQPDVRKCSALQFVSYFIRVGEEISEGTNTLISDRHVKELLQEYQQNGGESLDFLGSGGDEASAQFTDNSTYEKYEKSNPKHGDKMFHHFCSKIKVNQDPILRYGRDNKAPLLLYPLQECPKKCPHCQGDVVFELQILPTLISKLKLTNDALNTSRLEFGTVLVFTCRNSCWSTDTQWRYETVVLQREIN